MSGRSIVRVVRRLRGPVLLGIAAVVVVAMAISLLGSDGPISSPNLSESRAQEDPTEGTTPVPEVQETEEDFDLPTNVTTYEVFLARDPFEPVIPEPVSADGDGGTTDSPTTTPTTTPVDGDGDGTGDGNGTGDGTTDPDDGNGTADGNGDPSPPPDERCVQEKSVSCDGQNVSLVDVFTENGTAIAVVRVDEVVYEVEAGEQFADNFVVRSIEDPCATLQYGDDAFTLCEGEAVLK